MKNNWQLNKENITAALIVAHPDDETIFCGGTLLTYPFWNWHIVCVTMQTHTTRSQEFRKAMEMYKGNGVNIEAYLTLEKRDENQDLSQGEFDDWKNSLQELNLSPDIVFTHNIEGEYGHKHHKAVSKIVNEIFSNVWEFAYPGDKNITAQPTKSKVNEVRLQPDVLNLKRVIFNNSYVSQLYIWGILPGIERYYFTLGSPEIFTSD